MAAFSSEDDWGRLDFRLLRDGSITLFYKQPVLEESVEWLESHDYQVHVFDCTQWKSKRDALANIAESLQFPNPHENYARSLDAFNDDLRDVEVPAEGGICLVFIRYDAFNEKETETAQAILDTLEYTSRYFLVFGRRFMTLVQSDDPQISFGPTGCLSPIWNRKEWLNKDRGL